MTIQDAKVTIASTKKLNRIPTGIPSFDTIVRGGFPSGSLVLLLGDVGAGYTEFAYTSAARLSILRNEQALYSAVKEQLGNLITKDEGLKLPETVCYVSIARSKEDIQRELERSYPSEFGKTWNSKSFFFKDFSTMYFNPVSPTLDVEGNWPSIKAMKGEEKWPFLRDLVSALDFHAPNSMVIIDSLTQLIRVCNMNWRDFILFLEDLQRKSKKWDGLVYLQLARNILESNKEEEIMDAADGVLVFEWSQEGFTRQQTMYIRKFRELMPHIAKDNMAKFDTAITSTDGFVVTNVKRISGRI